MIDRPLSSTALIVLLDDHLYCLLTRPWMYAQSCEALWACVTVTLAIRNMIAGARTPESWEFWRPLDILVGNCVVFPDGRDDDFVAKLKALVEEQTSYEPGERPTLEERWQAHWGECKTCRSGPHCEAGDKLWKKTPHGRTLDIGWPIAAPEAHEERG